MARRTTSSTKNRTAGRKAAADGTSKPAAMKSSRGKRTKPQDEAVPEISAADALISAGQDEAPVAETIDIKEPAKTRRGRKPKSQETAVSGDGTEALDAPSMSVTPPDDGGESDVIAATKSMPATPSRRKRGDRSDKRDEPMPERSASDAASSVVGSSAAQWNADTGVATFDWPHIEQVAATNGPNQAMAKLLLAARAEGSNSRWPF